MRRMKRGMAGIISGFFALAMIVLFAAMPAPEAFAETQITSVAAYIDVPAIGKSPSYEATVDTGANYAPVTGVSGANKNGVSWQDVTESEFVDPDSSYTFKENHVYKVFINLQAKDGYTFVKGTPNTLNGVTGGGDYAPSRGIYQITYTFPVLSNDKVSINTTSKVITVNTQKPEVGKTPGEIGIADNIEKRTIPSLFFDSYASMLELDTDSGDTITLYEVWRIPGSSEQISEFKDNTTYVYYIYADFQNLFSKGLITYDEINSYTIEVPNISWTSQKLSNQGRTRWFQGFYTIGSVGDTNTGTGSDSGDAGNSSGSDGEKKTAKKNTLSMAGKTATIKYSKLKKKAQTRKVSKVINFKDKGQGKKSYVLSSAKKGKKSFKKYFKINKNTGKVTVKKGLKKGTYKVKVQVSAAGSSTHKAAKKSVTFKIKVK